MYLAQKNMLTADAAFIQSDLLAMQNQLEASQTAADRAVDLMFADKESYYNAIISKINILQPQVEKEEARYLAQIQMDLQNQQAELAELKAEKKEIQSMKLGYIENMANAGQEPDAGVLSSLGKAQSVDEAMDIIGRNLPEGITSAGKLDTQIITAGGKQILVNKQTGEVIQDFGGAYKPTGSGGSGGGTGDIKPFKFSSSQKTDLIGAGITNEEMGAIQINLENGFSLNEILDSSDFSDKEKEDISRTFTGEKEVEEEKSFIDDSYIKYQFEPGLWGDADDAIVEEDYPLSKYDTFGWQSKKTKEKRQKEAMDKAKKEWVESEIQDIKKQVEKLRKQGFSDEEIDKMI